MDSNWPHVAVSHTKGIAFHGRATMRVVRRRQSMALPLLAVAVVLWGFGAIALLSSDTSLVPRVVDPPRPDAAAGINLAIKDQQTSRNVRTGDGADSPDDPVTEDAPADSSTQSTPLSPTPLLMDTTEGILSEETDTIDGDLTAGDSLTALVDSPDESMPPSLTPLPIGATEDIPPDEPDVIGDNLATDYSPTQAASPTSSPLNVDSRAPDLSGEDLNTDYECVGWQPTDGCSPDGEPQQLGDCDTRIYPKTAGYCVFRHKQTDALRRVLPLHCDSMDNDKFITCSRAPELLAYGQRTLAYEHDPVFSFDANRAAALALLPSDPPPPSLKRGITMVVHASILGSAYASIRNLRELGCSLPVEMWYRADETKRDHPILKELVAKHGVFLRELTDPRATKFYTKLFAVFYSAFDSVLLLDADNFALKDPEYLFETVEFQQTGAMFWPDYWHPGATIFNIQQRSLVWPVFGLDYVDMFEQESGQVLINRRLHLKAMNAMMYYAVTLPRVFEELRLSWWDKDLFRFAWMKTESSFYFVDHPPGSLGKFHELKHQFCGLTMIQHDPQGEILFLHRNMQKLRVGSSIKRVWTHVQEFKRGSPTEEYSMGWSRVFDDINACWARFRDFEHYDVRPIDEFPFKDTESRLLQYAEDAGALS